MTVTVDASAGTFAISLDLNGPVLASADPAPQPFTGTVHGGRRDYHQSSSAKIRRSVHHHQSNRR